MLIIIADPLMGEVTAWVNKNPVMVGELFQLQVEAKNVDDPEEPDLGVIRGLEILNRSVQNKTSIIGTSFTSTVSWTYVMIAPAAGEYQIPPLKVGKEKTAPILLKAVESALKSKQESVRLEVVTEPRKVYPQQQVLTRIRIIRTGIELENETITPLEPAGAHVEKLNQATYKTVEDGKKQVITEITYAVIPNKSGTLTIPQLRYQGDKKTGSALNRNFGNFGNFGNIFKSRGQRIFSTSKPQTVEVMPLPKQNKGWWLPAKNLEISENWQPEPPVFKVGEPVTRTLTIIAEGVTGNQIPELAFNYPDTIKGYADQPQIETEHSANGLRGIRKEKWALIPGRNGIITLPEISVSWWDVTTNTLRTVVIPSKEIQVKTAVGRVTENITPEVTEDPVKENTAIVAQEPADVIKSSMPWKILAIVFALLWTGTLLIWFFNRNKKVNREIKIENNFKGNQQVEIKSAVKKVEQALRSGEPVAVQDALLKWGNSVWSDDPPQGLEQIGDRIPKLKKGIKSLNSVLYGSKQNDGTLEELKNDFYAMTSNEIESKKYNKNNNLSPLYPE